MPGNYGLYTTSRIEYAFVSAGAPGADYPDHETAREGLDLEEWPGAERDRTHGTRLPRTVEEFAEHWASVDRKLHVAGEQALSLPEFFGLRLYTGPMFMKYNGVLRAGSGVKFLEQRCQELCLGNTYATTLHILSAAIIKLGKVVRAEQVYRAPGNNGAPLQTAGARKGHPIVLELLTHGATTTPHHSQVGRSQDPSGTRTSTSFKAASSWLSCRPQPQRRRRWPMPSAPRE